MQGQISVSPCGSRTSFKLAQSSVWEELTVALSHLLLSGLSLVPIAFSNCSSLWPSVLGALLKVAFLLWVDEPKAENRGAQLLCPLQLGRRLQSSLERWMIGKLNMEDRIHHWLPSNRAKEG